MTDSADRSPHAASPVRPGVTAAPPLVRSDPPSQHRRFWLRLLIVLAAVAGLWLVHEPLLRGVAGLLVVDEPADHFQYVSLSSCANRPDGDRAYDAAVTLFRQNPSCHILLIRPTPTRLIESGALASFETVSRRELAARGLPQKAIAPISSDGFDDWATARRTAGVAARSTHGRGGPALRSFAKRSRSPRVKCRARLVPSRSGAAARVARPAIRRNQLVAEPRRVQGVWHGMAPAILRMV